MSTRVINTGILNSSEAPPTDYDRAPTHARMIRETDVYVPMPDGVKICVDIYRPETTEKLPALLAFAIYNKDFQGPEVAEQLPPQPAWTPLWTGPLLDRVRSWSYYRASDFADRRADISERYRWTRIRARRSAA